MEIPVLLRIELVNRNASFSFFYSISCCLMINMSEALFKKCNCFLKHIDFNNHDGDEVLCSVCGSDGRLQ